MQRTATAQQLKPARRASCVWPPLMQVEEVSLPQLAFDFAFGPVAGADLGAGSAVAAPVTPPLCPTGGTFPAFLKDQAI
jgi:hypothetical protein